MSGFGFNADQMSKIANFLEGLDRLTEETGITICIYEAAGAELDGQTFWINRRINEDLVTYVVEERT